MAITVYGVEANLDITQWSWEAWASQLVAPSPHGVIQGFNGSVASGDRRVSASSNGIAYAPGVRIVSDAVAVVPLDANTSGNPRIDLVCLQVDWGKNAAEAGTIVAVKGSPGASPADPSLTQTPGVKWQIPLARVRVEPGATSINGKLDRIAPVVDTGYVPLNLPGTWEQTPLPVAVCRANGMVEAGGRMKRIGGNVSEASGTDLGVVIPEGFRPRRQILVTGVTRWGTSTSEAVGIGIEPDGSMQVYPAGSNLATGDTVRFQATWLPEV